MDNKPTVDLSFLAPIILAVVSILGMAAIFFINRANALRPAEETPATNTPFRYIYLGTEPGLSTLTPEPTATPIFIEPPEFTDTPDSNGPLFSTATAPGPFNTAGPSGGGAFTPPAFPTQPLANTVTPSPSPTIQAIIAKYDDTYSQIYYDGTWTAQSNVTDVYQNTLHISFETENYLVFAFVGEQIIITFQAGPSLGDILIDLDGLEFEVSQSDSQTGLKSWTSAILVNGSHEIVIEHLSGGSINIDSITIPYVGTSTPAP